jgi:hypothetical protein
VSPPGGTAERAHRDPAFRERLEAAPLEAVRGEALTAAERRWLVLPSFGWLMTREARLHARRRRHHPAAA